MFAIRWWLANLSPEENQDIICHQSIPQGHFLDLLPSTLWNCIQLCKATASRQTSSSFRCELWSLVRGEMSWEHGHSLARLPQGCDKCPVQGSSTVYFKCHQSDSAHSVCLKLVHDECKDEQNAPLVDEIFNILVQGAGKGKKGMFCSWNWVAETGRHFHKDWTSHGIKPAHASFCRQWRKLWRCFEGTPVN